MTTVDLGGWDVPTALAIDDVGRILVRRELQRSDPSATCRWKPVDPFYGTGKPPAEFDGNVHDMALLVMAASSLREP